MNIGITGGSSLIELGSSAKLIALFAELSQVSAPSSADAALILDRLYRRYVRAEDLMTSRKVLEQMITIVRSKSKSIDVEFAERFLRAFEKCSESATANLQAFRDYSDYTYEPVRIVPVDQVRFTMERLRDLKQYDSLEGLPYWQQQGGADRPNKSVEVTPTAVTPAADAPGAPSAGVPHH